MTKPLVVSIPHQLGKAEAERRLKTGFGNVRANYGALFSVDEENWASDRLVFRVSALGQAVSGSIDVAEDQVHLEVYLPWLLAKFAQLIQPQIAKEGTLLLEKK